MWSDKDCNEERRRVVLLHVTCRVVGSQGSTRSWSEQEDEGNREKGFDNIKDFADKQWIPENARGSRNIKGGAKSGNLQSLGDDLGIWTFV